MIYIKYKIIIIDDIRGVRMLSHKTSNEVLANILLRETQISNPKQRVVLEMERFEKEVENAS